MTYMSKNESHIQYIHIHIYTSYEIVLNCFLTSCDSIIHLQKCNKYADLVSSHLIKWNSIHSSSHYKGLIFNIFYICFIFRNISVIQVSQVLFL